MVTALGILEWKTSLGEFYLFIFSQGFSCHNVFHPVSIRLLLFILYPYIYFCFRPQEKNLRGKNFCLLVCFDSSTIVTWISWKNETFEDITDFFIFHNILTFYRPNNYSINQDNNKDKKKNTPTTTVPKSHYFIRSMSLLSVVWYFCMFQACWQSWTPLWAHWAWRQVWAPWSITRDRVSTGWGWTAKRWSDQQPAAAVAAVAAGCLQTLRAASHPWAAPQACDSRLYLHFIWTLTHLMFSRTSHWLLHLF